jgi:hypothetical protein
VQGLQRLAAYRKEWDRNRGCWKDDPLHDQASHGADAFRQYGQRLEAGENFGITLGALAKPQVGGLIPPSSGRLVPGRMRGRGSMTA